MKLPRIRTVLFGLALLFALFYLAGAIAVMNRDDVVPPLTGAPGDYSEVAIFGASGTAGDGILEAALADPSIRNILVLTRRETPRIREGVKLGKVTMLLHQDYLKFDEVIDRFSETSHVYWAIGLSSFGVDEATYAKIHVDFPREFVAAWNRVAGPGTRMFHYISSSDISESSTAMWAREKLRAEKVLIEMAGDNGLSVIAYRPDYIGPTDAEAHIGQDLLYWFFAPVSASVRATAIGQAMLEVSARRDSFENGKRLSTFRIRRLSDAYEARRIPTVTN